MKINLTLSEVYALLKELEHDMQIKNRDLTNVYVIYNKIMDQLDKQDVEISS